MDEIDLKLLRLLQEERPHPIKALAGEFAFPPLRFPRAAERLEKQGVGLCVYARSGLLQLGHHILAYIHLDMQPTQKEEFYPFVLRAPNVLECNCDRQLLHTIKVSFASTQELNFG